MTEYIGQINGCTDNQLRFSDGWFVGGSTRWLVVYDDGVIVKRWQAVEYEGSEPWGPLVHHCHGTNRLSLARPN